MRIKCNRCGKKNDNLFGNNNYHHKNEIGEGLNEIYYCPFMKAKIFLGKNNQKNNIKFIERPGDWICYNCQNLNFKFRMNCNRCHMSKLNNKNLIQNLEKNRNMMNMNNIQ